MYSELVWLGTFFHFEDCQGFVRDAVTTLNKRWYAKKESQGSAGRSANCASITDSWESLSSQRLRGVSCMAVGVNSIEEGPMNDSISSKGNDSGEGLIPGA